MENLEFKAFKSATRLRNYIRQNLIDTNRSIYLTPLAVDYYRHCPKALRNYIEYNYYENDMYDLPVDSIRTLLAKKYYISREKGIKLRLLPDFMTTDRVKNLHISAITRAGAYTKIENLKTLQNEGDINTAVGGIWNDKIIMLAKSDINLHCETGSVHMNYLIDLETKVVSRETKFNYVNPKKRACYYVAPHLLKAAEPEKEIIIWFWFISGYSEKELLYDRIGVTYDHALDKYMGELLAETVSAAVHYSTIEPKKNRGTSDCVVHDRFCPFISVCDSYASYLTRHDARMSGEALLNRELI